MQYDLYLLVRTCNIYSSEPCRSRAHSEAALSAQVRHAHEKYLHLDGFDFDNDLGTPRGQKALLGATCWVLAEVRLLAQPVRWHQRVLSNAAALEVMHCTAASQTAAPTIARTAAIVATMPVPPV